MPKRGKRKNLLKKGDVFNDLTVIEEVDTRDAKGRPRRMVKCECECGTIKDFDYYALTKGRLKGCGCNYKLDITNKKVGLLTAKHPLDKRDPHERILWLCECDCGNTIEYAATYLLRAEKNPNKGKTSCGCADVTDKEKGEQLQKTKMEYVVDGISVPNLTMKTPKHNTSGHKGVSWSKKRKKWVATIKLNYKTIQLGASEKLEEAVRMRKEGEEKYFKPYIEKLENKGGN